MEEGGVWGCMKGKKATMSSGQGFGAKNNCEKSFFYYYYFIRRGVCCSLDTAHKMKSWTPTLLNTSKHVMI
jgi:hypothetical protein